MKYTKLLLLTLISVFVFTGSSFAAGTSTEENVSKYEKLYNKGALLIKQGKKLEKKDKIEKAKKKYLRAIKYLEQSNQVEPGKPNTLNYLGFALRKTGNFEDAEKFYLEGLKIDPKHVGINEYLGELYIATNRLDKAKERLKVLETCNCEEYSELKNLINQN
jgi:tetratricopeptide (TPR) repeat protein